MGHPQGLATWNLSSVCNTFRFDHCDKKNCPTSMFSIVILTPHFQYICKPIVYKQRNIEIIVISPFPSVFIDSDNTWGETPPRKPSSASRGTRLYDLRVDDSDYTRVAEQMQSTIREHRDCAGGVFNRYNIIKVCRRQWLLLSNNTICYDQLVAFIHFLVLELWNNWKNQMYLRVDPKCGVKYNVVKMVVYWPSCDNA